MALDHFACVSGISRVEIFTNFVDSGLDYQQFSNFATKMVDRGGVKVLKCMKLQLGELHRWNFDVICFRLHQICLRESHGWGGSMRMESLFASALTGARG